MTKPALTAKEEKFAQAFIRNVGDKVQSYKDAGYSVRMSTAAIGVQSDKLYNKPKINLRIQELQAKAAIIADEKFTITVEQRLKWLEDIVESGLGEYTDAQENKRKENLPAARSAIDTLNTMLGTTDNDGQVKPVKVFVGVVDAS